LHTHLFTYSVEETFITCYSALRHGWLHNVKQHAVVFFKLHVTASETFSKNGID